MRRRTRAAGIFAAVLALALALPPEADAQARRGTQQRQQRATPRQTDAATQRQAELLLDRFAQRVGQALHLNRAQTQRLQRELQVSRHRRNEIRLRARQVRQELGRLVQQEPADEARVGELLDTLIGLEVEAAQVAVDEHRRLAEFLTPLQRARVIWLQQRLARQAADRQGATDTPPSDRPPF